MHAATILSQRQRWLSAGRRRLRCGCHGDAAAPRRPALPQRGNLHGFILRQNTARRRRQACPLLIGHRRDSHVAVGRRVPHQVRPALLPSQAHPARVAQADGEVKVCAGVKRRHRRLRLHRPLCALPVF